MKKIVEIKNDVFVVSHIKIVGRVTTNNHKHSFIIFCSDTEDSGFTYNYDSLAIAHAERSRIVDAIIGKDSL